MFPSWKQQLRLLSEYPGQESLIDIPVWDYIREYPPYQHGKKRSRVLFDIDSRYETQTVCRSIQTSINDLYVQGLFIVIQLKVQQGLSLLGYISESLLCERSVKRHNLPPCNIQVGQLLGASTRKTRGQFFIFQLFQIC